MKILLSWMTMNADIFSISTSIRSNNSLPLLKMKWSIHSALKHTLIESQLVRKKIFLVAGKPVTFFAQSFKRGLKTNRWKYGRAVNF